MLRTTYTLTYTSATSMFETATIDQMVELSRQKNRSKQQNEALEQLQHALSSATQIRITVAQVNGLQNAKYHSLTGHAREYFTEQTGYPIPLPNQVDETGEEILDDKGNPKVIELEDWQEAIFHVAYNAAAALAATSKVEMREVKPTVTAEGVTFPEDGTWQEVPIPSEFATVAGWVENCPATLQDAWARKAYDANPNLWRRGGDQAAKNFDAVSVK